MVFSGIFELDPAYSSDKDSDYEPPEGIQEKIAQETHQNHQMLTRSMCQHYQIEKEEALKTIPETKTDRYSFRHCINSNTGIYILPRPNYDEPNHQDEECISEQCKGRSKRTSITNPIREEEEEHNLKRHDITKEKRKIRHSKCFEAASNSAIWKKNKERGDVLKANLNLEASKDTSKLESAYATQTVACAFKKKIIKGFQTEHLNNENVFSDTGQSHFDENGTFKSKKNLLKYKNENYITANKHDADLLVSVRHEANHNIQRNLESTCKILESKKENFGSNRVNDLHLKGNRKIGFLSQLGLMYNRKLSSSETIEDKSVPKVVKKKRFEPSDKKQITNITYSPRKSETKAKNTKIQNIVRKKSNLQVEARKLSSVSHVAKKKNSETKNTTYFNMLRKACENLFQPDVIIQRDSAPKKQSNRSSINEIHKSNSFRRNSKNKPNFDKCKKNTVEQKAENNQQYSLEHLEDKLKLIFGDETDEISSELETPQQQVKNINAWKCILEDMKKKSVILDSIGEAYTYKREKKLLKEKYKSHIKGIKKSLKAIKEERRTLCKIQNILKKISKSNVTDKTVSPLFDKFTDIARCVSMNEKQIAEKENLVEKEPIEGQSEKSLMPSESDITDSANIIESRYRGRYHSPLLPEQKNCRVDAIIKDEHLVDNTLDKISNRYIRNSSDKTDTVLLKKLKDKLAECYSEKSQQSNVLPTENEIFNKNKLENEHQECVNISAGMTFKESNKTLAESNKKVLCEDIVTQEPEEDIELQNLIRTLTESIETGTSTSQCQNIESEDKDITDKVKLTEEDPPLNMMGMEHYKKRLIQQHENPPNVPLSPYATTEEEDNCLGSPSSPNSNTVIYNGLQGKRKDEVVQKVARKRAVSRRHFRHQNMELFKLGTSIPTSLCKTKEPYNICTGKNLQMCCQNGAEKKCNKNSVKGSLTESIINTMDGNKNKYTPLSRSVSVNGEMSDKQTSNSITSGRHILPAIVPELPKRRKRRVKSLPESNEKTAKESKSLGEAQPGNIYKFREENCRVKSLPESNETTANESKSLGEAQPGNKFREQNGRVKSLPESHETTAKESKSLGEAQPENMYKFKEENGRVKSLPESNETTVNKSKILGEAQPGNMYKFREENVVTAHEKHVANQKHTKIMDKSTTPDCSPINLSVKYRETIIQQSSCPDSDTVFYTKNNEVKDQHSLDAIPRQPNYIPTKTPDDLRNTIQQSSCPDSDAAFHTKNDEVNDHYPSDAIPRKPNYIPTKPQDDSGNTVQQSSCPDSDTVFHTKHNEVNDQYPSDAIPRQQNYIPTKTVDDSGNITEENKAVEGHVLVTAKIPTNALDRQNGFILINFPQVQQQMAKMENPVPAPPATVEPAPLSPMEILDSAITTLVNIVNSSVESAFNIMSLPVLNRLYIDLSRYLVLPTVSIKMKMFIDDALNKLITYLLANLFHLPATSTTRQFLSKLLQMDLRPHMDYLISSLDVIQQKSKQQELMDGILAAVSMDPLRNRPLYQQRNMRLPQSDFAHCKQFYPIPSWQNNLGYQQNNGAMGQTNFRGDQMMQNQPNFYRRASEEFNAANLPLMRPELNPADNRLIPPKNPRIQHGNLYMNARNPPKAPRGRPRKLNKANKLPNKPINNSSAFLPQIPAERLMNYRRESNNEQTAIAQSNIFSPTPQRNNAIEENVHFKGNKSVNNALSASKRTDDRNNVNNLIREKILQDRKFRAYDNHENYQHINDNTEAFMKANNMKNLNGTTIEALPKTSLYCEVPTKVPKAVIISNKIISRGSGVNASTSQIDTEDCPNKTRESVLKHCSVADVEQFLQKNIIVNKNQTVVNNKKQSPSKAETNEQVDKSVTRDHRSCAETEQNAKVFETGPLKVPVTINNTPYTVITIPHTVIVNDKSMEISKGNTSKPLNFNSSSGLGTTTNVHDVVLEKVNKVEQSNNNISSINNGLFDVSPIRDASSKQQIQPVPDVSIKRVTDEFHTPPKLIKLDMLHRKITDTEKQQKKKPKSNQSQTNSDDIIVIEDTVQDKESGRLDCNQNEVNKVCTLAEPIIEDISSEEEEPPSPFRLNSKHRFKNPEERKSFMDTTTSTQYKPVIENIKSTQKAKHRLFQKPPPVYTSSIASWQHKPLEEHTPKKVPLASMVHFDEESDALTCSINVKSSSELKYPVTIDVTKVETPHPPCYQITTENVSPTPAKPVVEITEAGTTSVTQTSPVILRSPIVPHSPIGPKANWSPWFPDERSIEVFNFNQSQALDTGVLSTGRQSVKDPSVRSKYCRTLPQELSEEPLCEIKIDSEVFRVKKSIYERIPKGKLCYIRDSNSFIRYFDEKQMELFINNVDGNPLAGNLVNQVRGRAESFLEAETSGKGEIITLSRGVMFSNEDFLPDPEMYVEEVEKVDRYIPKDFYGFYKFVTGYQIVNHHHPISFQTFLTMHNTNGTRGLFKNYVNTLMEEHTVL